MSIPLDTAPSAPTRKPGDFRRKGVDGPPYVPSLTKTRQPTGNKADLIAKCEARGIDVPAKVTVAQLKELLGPEPADELYGRPSGFGDPLENQYALRKHIERGIGAGVIKLVLGGLDPTSVDLEDTDALDRLVIDAQDAVESMIWADRGTFVHQLVERLERGDEWKSLTPEGEALGIPAPLQLAIVQGWVRFRYDLALTSLRCELPVVNDDLRIAGTLDLLDLAGRDLDTELGAIRAGQAVIADVKTGDLWDKFAVQIAGYQGATPFDTETEQRGTWPTRPIDPIGLIYHMSMKDVLDGAPVRWEAIPVDLAVGREGARICVEARDWPSRPVFGAPIVVEGCSASTNEAATHGSAQPTAVKPEGHTSTPPAPAVTRDDLAARYQRMLANARDTGWGDEFLRRYKAFGLTKDSTIDEITAALDALEPPFDPEPQVTANPQPVVEVESRVDDGAPLDDATLDTLLSVIRNSDARAVVNGWLEQADPADTWSPRVRPYVRQFEISRAALALAVGSDGSDDVALAVIAAALDRTDEQHPVGRLLASLTIDEARRVHAVATAFADAALTLTFTDAGQPVVGGDVAAVLAAA